jgi:flagellar hook protein FlgE
MSFNIALSGLQASRSDLDVTANNIANANTTGFKRSRAEFADVFSQAYNGNSSLTPGNGVRLAAITQQFDQGNIENSSSNLDLAINGQGFFTLRDDSGQVYSRDGAFQVDREGFVVNSSGYRLQAFPSLDDEGTQFNTGGLSDLRLDTGIGPPSATTRISTALNFRADAELLGGTGADIDPLLPDSYSYTTAITVYDSLGSPHTATLYVRRTTDLEYSTRVYVDGVDLGTQDLAFDANGALVTAQPMTFPNTFTPTNGASPLNLDYDFTGSTLLGSSFSINDQRQDGFTTGRLSGLEITAEGVVAARYTNGRSVALGKVALANFDNPQGLSQVGNNAWTESFDSGAAVLGEAGTASLGLIQSGGLESSNVDLSQQLVNLITAQRNFQANSQVISTADEITQTAINLGR